MGLFPREYVVGIFRGFSEGGMEFHADLVLPYRSEFHSIPMHGQFILVQLADETEAVLGRIASIGAEGRLTMASGEDFTLRALAEDRPIPEDLLDQYLKYRVNIRVLGVLRETAQGPVFAPSLRRLPHLGSRVAFLAPDLLRYVAGQGDQGAELGFFALGEFIYADRDQRLRPQSWMRIQAPSVTPRFPIHQLVSRRTFIFARAGFGKSNLNKLLFAGLYEGTPTVEKRGGRRVPVGTLIFDPDGEYFWPDDKNRPGLCDVPHLQDKLVVFTNRKAPSPFYGSFVAGGVKLDIRRLRPADVIAIALPPEKQDQQNVHKLRGLNMQEWWHLVDAIARDGNRTDPELLKELLKLDKEQSVEALAARSNMTNVVRMLHDPSSQLLDMLKRALRDGKICVVDVSQMRGQQSLVLSGLILREIFNHNQEQFTEAEPETIPTIAVIEEAQTVLGERGGATAEPYVEWVKEGRKYDLGAVLITQQPGSIATEILSQGDNWFVFHLLSSQDLAALKRANSHFSDDLLSSLLNEPIPGHCVFWSSSGGRPYPIPIRVFSFEERYSVLDPDGSRGQVDTYARRLRVEYERLWTEGDRPEEGLPRDREELQPRRTSVLVTSSPARASQLTERAGSYQVRLDGSHRSERTPQETAGGGNGGEQAPPERDVLRQHVDRALETLARNGDFVRDLKTHGMSWWMLARVIEDLLPPQWTDRNDIAFQHVRSLLDMVLGEGRWTTERRTLPNGKSVLWVVPGQGVVETGM